MNRPKEFHGHRNHNFDLLRILFATLVILAHAYVLSGQYPDLLVRYTHTQYNLGSLAVSGFFLLSGFLIVQSWSRDPDIVDYAWKRLLRIVPGYLVAAVLSTIVIGLLAPGVSHFFYHFNHHFPESILLFGPPSTPAVFPHSVFENQIDDSLWTIPYELRCYLLVVVFGICGLLRRRWPVVILLIISLFLMADPSVLSTHWHKIYFLTGEPWPAARLLATFLVGACFYLFRNRIVFQTSFAMVAAILLIGILCFLPRYFEPAAVTLGAYLLFYAGDRMPFQRTAWIKRMPDISYGVYLYGWPIEALWLWYRHTSAWITFFAATTLAYFVGWLSWRYIERPMLKLKRRPAHRPRLVMVEPPTDEMLII